MCIQYTPFCLSTDGHMNCFYTLAVVNNVDMKIGVQTSVQVPAFNSLGYIPDYFFKVLE